MFHFLHISANITPPALWLAGLATTTPPPPANPDLNKQLRKWMDGFLHILLLNIKT